MSSGDPYFDEGIGDLKNLLCAKSSKEFQEREPQIVFANELELETVITPYTPFRVDKQTINKSFISSCKLHYLTHDANAWYICTVLAGASRSSAKTCLS